MMKLVTASDPPRLELLKRRGKNKIVRVAYKELTSLDRDTIAKAGAELEAEYSAVRDSGGS